MASCKNDFLCTLAERTSLNEFRMLKYFKSKWKRSWIISRNIWANIAVTKHVLLADEFILYWPRLLGFHSLHVNAMKCLYVGFSLSKLQSFLWKISLKSRLIRLKDFNNKISITTPCVPRGVVVKLRPDAPKVGSSNANTTFISSLLFFSFLLFFFSFRLVFLLRITVLLCFYIFFSALLVVPPKSFARSCDLHISSKYLNKPINEMKNLKNNKVKKC